MRERSGSQTRRRQRSVRAVPDHWLRTTAAGLWAQLRKQNNVSDRVLIREQHRDAIDAHAEAAGWRHAVLERGQKVLIERLGLDITRLARAHLLQEPLALYPWIVQLR